MQQEIIKAVLKIAIKLNKQIKNDRVEKGYLTNLMKKAIFLVNYIKNWRKCCHLKSLIIRRKGFPNY